jgi:hypothetical protein
MALCKWVCRKVRWGVTQSHLMLRAAPTNVKQPSRIFSPPSCKKPKSQAPLNIRTMPSDLTALSTRRRCHQLTKTLFWYNKTRNEPKTIICVPDRPQMFT